MIPAIFRAEAAEVGRGADPAAAERRGRRLSGALIGIAGAVGAFGGVLVNLAFRQSFLDLPGTATPPTWPSSASTRSASLVTWAVYLRPRAAAAGRRVTCTIAMSRAALGWPPVLTCRPGGGYRCLLLYDIEACRIRYAWSFVRAPGLTSARDPRPTTRQGRPVRTYSPKPGEIERQWHVIDASDVVLGRLATHAATLLRGKHKPTFAPHVDTGDFVVIVNAGKVALTGNKRQTKVAYRHSGYPGGLKQVGYDELLTKRPERAIELAVKGMLPHNKLGRQLIKKLKVYAGAEHPHARAAAGAVRDQADRAVSAGEGSSMTDITETEVADPRGRRAAPAPVARAPRGDRPIQTVGRRKEAIVRVRIVPGTGKITCNGRDLEAYFPSKVHQQLIKEPLVTAEKPEAVRRHRQPAWRRHHRPGRCAAAGHRPGADR